MSKPNCCLLVCRNYQAEVEHILRTDEIQGVEVRVFPARCGHPPLQEDELLHATENIPSDCDTIFLLGGLCLTKLSHTFKRDKRYIIETRNNCFYFLTNRELIDHFIRSGNYLVTPGWISSWQEHFQSWGFDRTLARQFFHEFASTLLLLDTGVSPDSQEQLQAMASFLQLPAKTLPLGLDVFRLSLYTRLKEWQAQKQQKQLKTNLGSVNKKLADHAMMSSLLSKIASIQSEKVVINNILELFTILCAPARIFYLPVLNGEPGKPLYRGKETHELQKQIQRAENLQDAYALTDSGDGFLVKVDYNTETVGILILECVAFPEYTQHYLNLAHNIGPVCGLAIDNSRKYQRLEQARLELLDAKNAADAANQAKSEFLSNVSHELRTPLNGILGYAQILKRDDQLKESQFSGLDVIERSGQHLLQLINEILELSKIEARKMEIENAAFHLPSLLNSVENIIRIRTEQQQIHFQCEYSAALPDFVYGDEKRLNQILLNLLNNAVKFTQEGGVFLRVTYSRSEGHNPLSSPCLRFEVEDSGIGIPPEKLDDIFSPFVQVGEFSRSIEGTGLGLAISRQLVRLMGGELSVKSTLGKGSLFYFELVFDVASGTARQGDGADNEGYIIGYKGKRRKILVVDDRWENRVVLSSLLSPLGFELQEALDGQEALESCSSFIPDLIFMDLVMPKLDGFEATRKIRNSPQLKHIKVIAASASSNRSPESIIDEAGFDDFIIKPIEFQNLFDVLARHLELEWVYKPPKAAEQNIMRTTEKKALSLELPPRSTLQHLHQAARRGDIMAIRQTIDELEQEAPRYEDFLTDIREPAQQFRIKDIREFLRHYLEDPQ